MHKLKLNLDDLRIESFETASLTDRRGTIRAHDYTLRVDTCGCYPPPPPGPSDGCTVGCNTGADCTGENNPGTVIIW